MSKGDYSSGREPEQPQTHGSFPMSDLVQNSSTTVSGRAGFVLCPGSAYHRQAGSVWLRDWHHPVLVRAGRHLPPLHPVHLPDRHEDSGRLLLTALQKGKYCREDTSIRYEDDGCTSLHFVASRSSLREYCSYVPCGTKEEPQIVVWRLDGVESWDLCACNQPVKMHHLINYATTSA